MIEEGKCNSDQQVSDSKSTQSHTRAKLSHKEFSAIVEANEPLIVLLEYTLTSNTMLSENSIQARLGGVRLPTTVIQFDAIVINLSNQIAMQRDIRNTLNCPDTSVIKFEIFALSDSGVHEAFDLTHERKVKWFVNLRLYLQRMGAIATPCVPLGRLSPEEPRRVAVVANVVAPRVAHLSVTKFLSEGDAEIPCPILRQARLRLLGIRGD